MDEKPVELPPDEIVWAVCPSVSGRDLKECERCPRSEMMRGEMCVRGCRAMAEEVVNIAQTGNPWRRADPATIPPRWQAASRAILDPLGEE